jgi:hypothetical protein
MGPSLPGNVPRSKSAARTGFFFNLTRKFGGMAREKYESLLRCPMCDRTGLADMSDDKSSKIGNYDTKVEAVTHGFEVKGKDVICSECQVSALPPKTPLGTPTSSAGLNG